MKLTKYQIAKIQKKISVSSNSLSDILLIDVMGDKSISNDSMEVRFNIYRVNSENTVLWQVSEKNPPAFSDGDPFCYLEKNDKGEIIADRFSGFEYKINPETGEATQIGFHK